MGGSWRYVEAIVGSLLSLGGGLLGVLYILWMMGKFFKLLASCTSLGWVALWRYVEPSSFCRCASVNFWTSFAILIGVYDRRLSLWLCATKSGVGAPRCAYGGSLRRFQALFFDLAPF